MKATRIYTLLALMLVVASTALTSCKKDSQIVGRWECTNAILTEGDHQMVQNSSIGKIWEFKENGELLKEGESKPSGYSIEGNNLTITDTLSDGTQVYFLPAVIQILTESQLSLLIKYNGAVETSENIEFKRL